MKLPELVLSWGTDGFSEELKSAIESMDGKTLKLQQGLERSSVASDDGLKAMVLSSHETAECIECKVGVFYSGFIAGCACDDDPTPQEAIPEYVDLRVRISLEDGSTNVALWQGD